MYKKLGSPCLYGHLGLCSAPCTERISLKEYKKEISYIKRFLSGDGTKLIRTFSNQMKKASKANDFEQAAYYRDILRKYEYVSQRFRSASQYIDNPNLTSDLREKALQGLVEVIPGLVSPPERIECYDISNLSGKDATASMVVAIGGKLSKAHYRQFKIKASETPNDFYMLEEAMRRRFKRKKEDAGWEMPDLVVIDGGKGQVSTVVKVLGELAVDIQIIGIAKQFETIIYLQDEVFHEVRLDRNNEGLKLLQNLRDEAHRFARRYHHLLRLRKLK